MEISVLSTGPQPDYELLDSGDGEKLERYGSVVLARPDPQALWPKRLDESEWRKAKAVFQKGDANARWKTSPEVPKKWNVKLANLAFTIKLGSFKHTGLFPEQLGNWEWMQKKITAALSEKAGEPISVLNLFGYTGGATLACAMAGAEVCHVDGSRVALTWAKENADASGLADKPIRWIPDDARSFVKKEIKRGKRYDAIIMDPPAFGRGPKGEVWKIETDLLPLLEQCKGLLSAQPLFVVISGYAAGYSAVAYYNALNGLFHDNSGVVTAGELTIAESSSSRLLPAGIFGRWSVN